jgi:hypothetical protein
MPRTLREITERAKGRGVQVVVHPHVHLELCRHYRCKYGHRYSRDLIGNYLKDREVCISSVRLDQAIAERWAARLHEQYSTDDDWEEAKLSTLGGTLRSEFVHEPGKMPMTTDWWVALEVAESGDDRIVVEDQGEEWAALRVAGRAMTADVAKQWLDSLPL